MSFDKEAYWRAKKDNVGSKRPKPTFTEIAEKHIVQLGKKLLIVNRAQSRKKPAAIRNTKKHRDSRSFDIDTSLNLVSLRIKRKEAGEKERTAIKKALYEKNR